MADPRGEGRRKGATTCENDHEFTHPMGLGLADDMVRIALLRGLRLTDAPGAWCVPLALPTLQELCRVGAPDER